MNFTKFSLISLLCLSFLTACGGGGGGGDGGSRGGNSARPQTGLRVLHASIGSAPVDVVVGAEGTVRTMAEFSQSSDWISTGVGGQSVDLRRATTTASIRSTSFDLTDGQVVSVLLYGDTGSFGERLSVIDDALPANDGSSASVRVVHGAFGALQVAASIDGQVISNGTAIGQGSDYVQVPAASAAIVRVRRVADGALLYQGTEDLQAGGVYTILVSGNADYLTIGRTLRDK